MEQVFINLSLSELEPIFKKWVKEATQELSFEKNDTKKETGDLLSIKQASEFLNLAVPTIYAKVSKKELPHMKRGNRLYFSRESLLNYIEGGRIQTIAEIEGEAYTYLNTGRRNNNA
ncbi:helix-turn-helix domain-containing protein [Winogradskyella sp.]|uniref:helix-turn-helix domain-containing protein n=1 Tax=Winogradskyella sp. TaxID=1883156 RepID=UPI002629B926|nr:helix-turn-helix domain-containing protein [Winogradskyella sp.]